MRARPVATLGLALLLAGASVVLARGWIIQQNQKVAPPPPIPQVTMTGVVVAAAPLRFGDEMTRDRVRLVDWPADAVPEGAFRSTERLFGPPGGAARMVLRAIETNEPILEAKITGFGAAASLSAMIAPGMRASTIPVNDVNGVAGFVRPGDRVDILLTRDAVDEGRGTSLVTDILLQDMKVLGVDQSTGPAHDRPGVARAVTLEVTPVQAQKLTLAQKLGTLSLALRHVRARDTDAPRTITVRDLRTGVAAAPDQAEPTPPTADRAAPVAATSAAAGPKPEVAAVRIVRGFEVSEYEVVSETLTAEDKVDLAPLFAWPFDWEALPDKLGIGEDLQAEEPRRRLVPLRGPGDGG